MNIIILSLFFAGVYLANAGIVSYVKDIPCGDGICPDGDTCCSDGCCPESNGVCCGNGKCCPSGYICADPLCIKPEDAPKKQVLKMLPTSFAKKEKLHNVTNIPCDGGTCPDGDTCCSGDTAPCCPTPNGVCCGDSTCCKTGTTCCSTGCCPSINAVCCSNGGCCPNGYSCYGDKCQPNSNEESAVLPQIKKLLPNTKTVKSKN